MIGLNIKLTAVATDARGTKVIKLKIKAVSWGVSTNRNFNSPILLPMSFEEGGLGARV